MSDFGIIYKVTNLINNKIYIGQTTGSLEKRKIKHISCAKLNSNIYFHKALNKYGIGSFDWEILENCEFKEELDEMEFHYIKQYNSMVPNGYNLTLGGEGSLNRRQSEETKRKISISKTGKKLSMDHRKKFSMMRSGVKKSKIHIDNVALAKSLYWKITFPSGEESIIKNLSNFCRQHNISDRGMWLVANGFRTHHKGYRCKKLGKI